mgnify:CR=1 FL=1
MIQEQNFNARTDASGGYKVDVSRGSNVDRVSSEWFSRPVDQRYLSLDDLFASVTFGMRRIHGEAEPMSDVESADYQALKAEYDALEAEHAEADELPEEVDARLGEIETAMETLQDRPIRFEAEDLALAGAFVSIDSSGRLRVERGHVRAEDEPVNEPEETDDADAETQIVEDAEDSVSSAVEDEEDEDGLKPPCHGTDGASHGGAPQCVGAGPAGRLNNGPPIATNAAAYPAAFAMIAASAHPSIGARPSIA